MEIQKINELFQALDNCPPIIDYSDSKNELDYAQMEALARLYSDIGFRSFLIQQYNMSIKSTALRSESDVDIAFGKARSLTFKEILVKGKKAYEGIEKLKKVKIPESSKQ